MKNPEKIPKQFFKTIGCEIYPPCALIDEQPKTEPIKETHSRKYCDKWDRMATDIQIFPS